MTYPTAASQAYKSQIRAIVDGETGKAFRVSTSAQATQAAADISGLEYMNGKGEVAATLSLSGSVVTGTGTAFHTTGAGEVFGDQFIRFYESTVATRWYRVLYSHTDIDIHLYEDGPTPSSAFDGYEVGTLNWRSIIFAPGEYNLDALDISPGVIIEGSPGARIVEADSDALQFLFSGDFIIDGVTFYPNQAFDSNDGGIGIDSDISWAGAQGVLNDVKIRHGGMGGDHSGGLMALPYMTGGTLLCNDLNAETSRGMQMYAENVTDIVNPVRRTRFIYNGCLFTRVAEWAVSGGVAQPCMLHIPSDADTLINSTDFIWPEMGHTAIPSGSTPYSAIRLGANGGIVGITDSENARLFCRDVNISVENASATPEIAALYCDEATAEVYVDNSQFEISSGNNNSSSVYSLAGSILKIANTTVLSDRAGVLAGSGSNIEVNNCNVSARVGVQIGGGGTVTINGGVIEGTTNSLANVSGALNIGQDVTLDGPVLDFGSEVYLNSGTLTLNGTTPVAATLGDASRLSKFARIGVSRVTSGTASGHISIESRVLATGFNLVSTNPVDDGEVEWWLYT